MKNCLKTKLLMMMLFMCFGVPKMYSQWTVKYLTDLYGDKTDAKVISQKDYNGLRITLFNKDGEKLISEVKVHPGRKNVEAKVYLDFSILEDMEDKEATLSIKAGEKTHTFKLSLHSIRGFDPFIMIKDKKDVIAFINLLKSESSILKCIVFIDGDLYRFKINPMGFSKRFN